MDFSYGAHKSKFDNVPFFLLSENKIEYVCKKEENQPFACAIIFIFSPERRERTHFSDIGGGSIELETVERKRKIVFDKCKQKREAI